MAKNDFYNEEDRDGAPDRCTCSTSSNPPCAYCTRHVDGEGEPCYCDFCKWSGVGEDLVEDNVQGEMVCPACGTDAIIYEGYGKP